MKIPIAHNSASGSPLLIDFDKHALALGKTGTGKSTLLFDVAVQHIRAGWDSWGNEIESDITL